MKAIQMLMDEHRVIERVLTALEIAAGRLEQGEEVRAAFFINAALFMKNYTDGCHHAKEEGILFPAMSAAEGASESSAVAVMLADHREGREFMAALRDAAQKWEKGDRSARGAVIHNSLGYVTLLRHHIQKEDKVLFPMAGEALTTAQQEQVETAFDLAGAREAEAGVQEKFQALAETLGKECTRTIL